jgi:flagellar basal-body rod protein FlgF
MDRMLYVAMSGASQTLAGQAVNANNLANASTTGFRADLLNFVRYDLQGPGYPTRIYSLADHTNVDGTPGSKLETGNDMDVAIDGDGWIAVQAPDGSEAYTRAGNLKISANGTLITGAGHPVKGDSGSAIAIPPAEKVDIGTDGSITIRPLGQSASALSVVDRIKLVKIDAADLVKGDDGLLRRRTGGPAPTDSTVRLTTGALESSNVNGVEAMVNMIALSRQFEMQIKMMKTAEDNDKASQQLMQIS